MASPAALAPDRGSMTAFPGSTSHRPRSDVAKQRLNRVIVWRDDYRMPNPPKIAQRAKINGDDVPIVDVKDYEISLAFVDNPTIHRLNKQYLDHDEPTDVLSFPYSAANANKLEGELVIGVQVAFEQATERGLDQAARRGAS